MVYGFWETERTPQVDWKANSSTTHEEQVIMRLLTLRTNNGFSLGIKKGSRVVDINAVQAKLGYERWDVPNDIHAVINGGSAVIERLEAVVNRALDGLDG